MRKDAVRLVVFRDKAIEFDFRVDTVQCKDFTQGVLRVDAAHMIWFFRSLAKGLADREFANEVELDPEFGKTPIEVMAMQWRSGRKCEVILFLLLVFIWGVGYLLISSKRVHK